MLLVNSYYLLFILLILLLFINFYIFKNLTSIKLYLRIVIALFIILSSSLMYYYSGGFVEIYKLNQMQDSQKMVLSIISRLEQVVNEDSSDAKGWYLLGKMYLKIDKEHDAFQALEKAHQLDKNNINYSVQYYWVKYILNNQLTKKDLIFLESLLQKKMQNENRNKIEKLLEINNFKVN
tara:strand:- start:110 stop:646 length:537 start_codon:yes stop_codon:yes gene_type:complete